MKVQANTLPKWAAGQCGLSTRAKKMLMLSRSTSTLVDLKEYRQELVNACQDLKQLRNGPVGQLYKMIFNVRKILKLLIV